jgi:hypothetical protein
MSNQFIVGQSETTFADREFAIVEASSLSEAVQKYVEQVAVKEELWLRNVYDRAINMSFAETFWLQGGEVGHFMETGRVEIDGDEFNRRVRQFFGEHQDFARLYLDFYWNVDEMPIEEFINNAIFPTEMLAYMWLNSNWSEVVAIPLDDIEKVR